MDDTVKLEETNQGPGIRGFGKSQLIRGFETVHGKTGLYKHQENKNEPRKQTSYKIKESEK